MSSEINKKGDISDISDISMGCNGIFNNIPPHTPPGNVTNGFAGYNVTKKDDISDISDINKNGSKKEISEIKPSLLLDDDSEVILHPAVGHYTFNEHETYYFGFNMNTRVPRTKMIGKKETNVWVKEKRLALITSDAKVIFPEDLEAMGYTMKTDLFMEKTPIKVMNIQKYLNDDYTILKATLKEIFDEIKKEFETYIDFPEKGDYIFLPLWIIGTYFFDLFFTYPYVHLHGLKGTAKSKVMQLSSKLTFNSEYLGSLTNAVLFRLVSQNKPTLYIDEFEMVNKQEQTKDDKDTETLLNNGYKKGMLVARMELDDKKWKARKFDVYCPKMIANISGLSGALPSRCVKIVMHRAKKGDERGDKLVGDDISGRWETIRTMLYIFALENWKGVGYYYNSGVEQEHGKPAELNNRDYELWKPILTIARMVGVETYKQILAYAIDKASEGKMDDDLEDSWESQLIESLAQVVNEERYYYVKEITDVLLEKFVESIAEYHGVENKVYKKVKPTTHWVGKTMRKLGFKNFKKDKIGHKYYLSQKLVLDVVARLQIEGIVMDKQTVQETFDNKRFENQEVKEETIE